MGTNSLMHRYLSKGNDKTQYDVFLNNGKKLKGVVKSVQDKTFIIESTDFGETIRSLVYFSKVGTIKKQQRTAASGKTNFHRNNDNIGNQAVSVTHKNRARVYRAKSQFKPSPSDIEQERLYRGDVVNGNY